MVILPRGNMSLKLRLVKGEDMLLEVPLSLSDWRKEDLIRELPKARRDARRITDIWFILGNESRIRMMTHLLRNENQIASFKEFQEDLGMNPKSIREHAMMLHRCGLLAFPERGRYRLLRRAGLRFMVLNLAFRRILRYLMEEYSEV